MRTWIEREDVPVPAEMQAALGGHPLVLQTLVRRGLTDLASARAFLNPEYYSPTAASELPDLEKAAQLLMNALQGGKKICVWGDFDVDGQTSTTLLVSTLRELGGEVSFHIPVRDRESHGVNLPELEKIIDSGAELILTCDTGITAHQAAAYARQRGVEMLITDHHDLPPELPEASAVVNPKRLPSQHPLATLPGVGVAYKLAEELCRRFGREKECERHLDLLALGVIADVAYQQGDVRYLLQLGLEALRHTPRLGLLKMMELAGVNPKSLTEEHIGFLLGPRLNALGRLADPNLSVEFFTTQDAARAHVLALQLEGLNEQRKLLTSQVFQAALAQIEADPTLLQTPVIVLAHPAWPAGVLGIVASRLVDHYAKPAILISVPPGETGRGSARSVEGIDISAAIAAQSHLLASFGGHPMAAGLAFSPGPDVTERVTQFRRALAKTIHQMAGEAPLEQRLSIDGYLPLASLSLEFVADLERLAPFGAGNPALTLVAPGMKLQKSSPLGKNDEHLLLEVTDQSEQSYRVIWWQGAGWKLPEGRFDLAYRARSTTFSGQTELQIEWVDSRPAQPETIDIQPVRTLEIVDYRHERDPYQRLKQLQTETPELQVWREGESGEVRLGRDRLCLTRAPALVIWTAPPGNAELKAALEQVNPRVIYLFGFEPGNDQPQLFLERLAGLVKYALKTEGGWIQISRLAAATAQRATAVQAGLAWLEARGALTILRQEDDQVCLQPGAGVASGDLPALNAGLKTILEESAAYRRYFKRADKDALFDFMN